MTPAFVWIHRAWNGLLWLLLAISVWQLGCYGRVLATFPYQADSKEGATLRSAVAFYEGRDPWAPANLVQDGNVHGLLDPWLAAKLLGPRVYRVECHRALAIAFLAAGALLMGLTLLSMGQDPVGAVAGGVAWAGANFFFVGLMARSDALAALLFLAPLALWLSRSRNWTLDLAAVLAALAVLTKLYAPLGGGLVVVGLWAEGRRGAAVRFGLCLAAALGAIYLAVGHAFPLYWPTMAMNLGNGKPNPGYAWFQSCVFFGALAWPLVLVWVWRAWPTLGLARQRALNLQTLLALALLSLWLGSNPGAYLQYYDQILEPLLILAVASGALPGWRGGLRQCSLVAAAVLAAHFNSSTFLPRFSPATSAVWAQTTANVAHARLLLAPSVLTVTLTQQGREIYDNGHISSLPPDPEPAIQHAYHASVERWRQRLRLAEADMVILPSDGPSQFDGDLGQYRELARLCLPVPLDFFGRECFRVLVPKPRASRRDRLPR